MATYPTTDFRANVLRQHGATEETIPTLLDLNAPRVSRTAIGSDRFPLPDEPHIEAWEAYASEAIGRGVGVWETLKSKLVQLQFPIDSGLSERGDYLDATRKGIFPDADTAGLDITEPSRLRLIVHRSIGGRVPIVSTPVRPDFESLVRAFVARGEPGEVPSSIGACLVSGLNNWDRIHTYQRLWRERHASKNPSPEDWIAEFQKLSQNKPLYQDRFILLSEGGYSGISGSLLGLTLEQWIETSYDLRLEHECCHYFTLRTFGRLQHNIVEEIVADLAAIVQVYGEYRSELALLFLGLERFPSFRKDGRLQQYCGPSPLPEDAFRVVQSLAVSSIHNLERIYSLDRSGGKDASLATLVTTVATLSLEEIAEIDRLTRKVTQAVTSERVDGRREPAP